MKSKRLPPLSPVEFRILLDKETLAYNNAVNQLKERLREFQKKCKHKNTHFESDPSGGRDSYTSCVDCDKIL